MALRISFALYMVKSKGVRDQKPKIIYTEKEEDDYGEAEIKKGRSTDNKLALRRKRCKGTTSYVYISLNTGSYVFDYLLKYPKKKPTENNNRSPQTMHE